MAQTQVFRGTARTIVQTELGRMYIYYRTAVVIVLPDNRIRLDSGGYKTVTTRTAMNQASNQDRLGFKVVQRKGEWFVTWKGRELPFVDGMTLDNIPAEEKPAPLSANVHTSLAYGEKEQPAAEEFTFTRAESDNCGNPRWVVHYLALLTKEEKEASAFNAEGRRVMDKYAIACKRANTIGGKKYRAKNYGGGIVFDTYSVKHTAQHISRVTGRNIVAIEG